MGACQIDIVLHKQASEAEIRQEFRRQQLEDKELNGSRGGYSGDFQTVNDVDCFFEKVYADEESAMKFCLRMAEKWESVIAVHFKNRNGKVSTLIAGWGAE